MRVPGGAESAKQCDKVLSCCSADQRSRPCHVARVARGGSPGILTRLLASSSPGMTPLRPSTWGHTIGTCALTSCALAPTFGLSPVTSRSSNSTCVRSLGKRCKCGRRGEQWAARAEGSGVEAAAGAGPLQRAAQGPRPAGEGGVGQGAAAMTVPMPSRQCLFTSTAAAISTTCRPRPPWRTKVERNIWIPTSRTAATTSWRIDHGAMAHTHTHAKQVESFDCCYSGRAWEHTRMLSQAAALIIVSCVCVCAKGLRRRCTRGSARGGGRRD